MDNAAAEQVKGNERTSKGELAGMKHAVDSTGRVLRDNVWGPQEEDAVRRDFTINAMYYDPETQVVVDYHGGFKDAKNRVMRMIGDPATRYREDPVRIIRAVRFAAKLSGLGFKLEAKTAAPLVKSHELLADVPQSRLFDEMLKLLQTGHALASIEQLKFLGLARGIYPLLDVVVERAEQPFVNAALQDTDRRVNEGKPVAPSFLLACVLWADVRDGWAQRVADQQHAHPALQDAIDDVFNARIGDVSGRGKLAGDMREIWVMQPRFEKRVGSAPFGLVDQPRFRAAFDFMRLRADVGEVDESLADWWQEFSMADDILRQDLIDQVRAEQTFVNAALKDTDRRVGEHKPVAPSFLLACVLWTDVREGWARRCKRGEHVMPALQDAIDDAFNAKIGDVSGRGKLGIDMREIWSMQPRFEKRSGSSPYSMLEQPRFRAGFDFLRLRAQTGEIDTELSEWWEKFSTAYDDERHEMVEQVRLAQLQKPQTPRSRVRRVDADVARQAPGPTRDGDPSSDLESAEDHEPNESGDAAPAKKRRRRRKPVNREGGAAVASPAPDSSVEH
jgi:poly(A) polymerase